MMALAFRRIRLAGLALIVLAGADEWTAVKVGPLVRLTHDGLDKERPSWSPDGRRLLFARHEPDGTHIWQYVLDTGAPGSAARRLTDRKEPEYNGAFSPDGKRMLFAAITLSGTQGNLDIASINADGTGLKTVVRATGKACRTRTGRHGRPMAGGSRSARRTRATRRSTPPGRRHRSRAR